jgi:hypothetical protein
MTLSADDHKLRAGHITSSTAAACLGFDPYCTPLQAWERIRNPQPREDAPPPITVALDPFTRGHMLEPALVEYGRRMLGLATDRKFRTCVTATVEHPDHSWAADSVDAIYYDDDGGDEGAPSHYCAEAKSVAWSDPDSSEWGEPWTDEVPRHVRVQCLWHMGHYHTACATIVPTIIGSGLSMRCYLVPRDNEAIAALFEVMEAWHYRHYVQGEPPPTRAGDLEIVRRIFRKPVLDAKEDDPVIAELVRRDIELRETIAQITEKREAVRAELAMRMRDYGSCAGPWGKVTFRKSADVSAIDYKGLARSLIDRLALSPDDEARLIEPFLSTRSGGRILRTYRSDGG